MHACICSRPYIPMGWSRSTDRWGGRGLGDKRCQLDEVACQGGGHGDHNEVDHHDQHGQPGEDRRMEPIAGPLKQLKRVSSLCRKCWVFSLKKIGVNSLKSELINWIWSDSFYTGNKKCGTNPSRPPGTAGTAQGRTCWQIHLLLIAAIQTSLVQNHGSTASQHSTSRPLDDDPTWWEELPTSFKRKPMVDWFKSRHTWVECSPLQLQYWIL